MYYIDSLYKWLSIDLWRIRKLKVWDNYRNLRNLGIVGGSENIKIIFIKLWEDFYLTFLFTTWKVSYLFRGKYNIPTAKKVFLHFAHFHEKSQIVIQLELKKTLKSKFCCNFLIIPVRSFCSAPPWPWTLNTWSFFN